AETRITTAETALSPGSLIGNYKVLGQIGIGGMGIVYAAQQSQPAERTVAIKLLKNLPDQNIIKSEIQILAQLNHPNIATLYEVNHTKDNDLFIVMELIEGRDIISWCKEKKYDHKQILQLFQELCLGISFAHEKGIIHCDIKPSNVLVTLINNKPTIKIIDFGISRLLSDEKINNFKAGTPAFLAPEIIESPTPLIADTRRDVYALGILLQRLLPDTTDHEVKSIINKAIAHNKNKRYATPVYLNVDIKRFLTNRPISALTHTPAYLGRLFIKRNALAMVFSMLLIISVIIGFFAQYQQATIAKKQAIAARQAQVEAEELSLFLTQLIETTNPENQSSTIITAEDILQNSKNKLLSIKEPNLKDARFMRTIGSIYTSREKYQRSLELLTKSVEIIKSKLGIHNSDYIAGISQLGLIYKKQGQYQKALNTLKKAISLIKQQPKIDLELLSSNYNLLGNIYFATEQLDLAIAQHQLAIDIRKQQGNTKKLGDSYNNLGVIYNLQKKWKQAEHYYSMAAEIFKNAYGEHHPYVATIQNNLAYIEEQNHRWENAEKLLSEAWVNWQFTYGENHSNTITAQRNLALFYDRRMKYTKAIKLFGLLIKHFETTGNLEKQSKYLSYQALSFAHSQDFTRAIQLHDKSLKLIKGTEIKEKYLAYKIRTRYAQSLTEAQNYDGAKQQLKLTLDLINKKEEKQNYFRLYTLNLLAKVYFLEGQIKQSQTIYEQVSTLADVQNYRSKPRYLNAQLGLAKIAYQLKQYDQATTLLLAALKMNKELYGEHHPSTALFYYQLGRCEQQKHNAKTSLDYFEQALSIQKVALPQNHKDLILTEKAIQYIKNME
ncbi:MAG: tetratricopeptide repeat protein, partial [bacterium]